jgi:hypothetical protein
MTLDGDKVIAIVLMVGALILALRRWRGMRK